MARAGWHQMARSLRAVRSAAAPELQAEELRSAWSARVRSVPATQWLPVAESITGTAQDGKAAAIISTHAISALGSDSAGTMEMILTVGGGPLPATFGFAVTRITEGQVLFS